MSASPETAPRPGPRPADQTRAPLLDAVTREARAARHRWHCPGHQGGSRSSAAMADLLGGDAPGGGALAADVWLDTTTYDRSRRSAEGLAAEAWRAQRAWLLGNGSSAGNLAWLLGLLGPGDEVVVARDAHISVLAGLAFCGARPVWVVPEIHPRLGLPLGVTAPAVTAALRGNPRARHVVLTSPGYASTGPDLVPVIAAARAAGADRVYVDQAWGPHLAFHPGLPPAALDAGADGCVVSVHKTATALSSGAILLAAARAGDEVAARLEVAVRLTQTTSPLMPLMASVDAARRDLATGGADAVARAVEQAARLRHRLRRIPGVRALDADALGLPAHRVDPLKVVVDVRGTGLTGWQVDRRLRRYGAPAEGADRDRVYLVVPAVPAEASADSEDALVGALARATGQDGRGRLRSRPAGADPSWAAALSPGAQVLTPAEARRRAVVTVSRERAVGRVAAEPVVPYPPGVPVIVPGERIEASTVDVVASLLASGGHVHGCADERLRTIQVVA
ncbi:MAG: hypothetical protein R2737_08825 [Candidatus Nanopelagicales bacterium]